MDKQRVGSGLRRLRRMLDLDQKEVAERLEMSQGAYSHWENGRTELRVSDLVRLSYGLKVPLGTLMRFLDIPIEERVLSPGQWVDSGAPSPTTLPTNPPLNRRAAAPLRTVAAALTRQDRGAGGGVIQSKVAPRPRELALAYG